MSKQSGLDYPSGFFAQRYEKLKERKGQILERINSLQAQIHAPDRNGDTLERSNTITENDRTKAKLGCSKKELAEIEAALEAFEAGTYTICEECGCTIDYARMEVVLYPKSCSSCLKAAKVISK